MPTFDGLLPAPHNSVVQDVLFEIATWHAYAKLRLHTTDTLDFFDAAVVSLGRTVRKFLKTTCDAYAGATLELPRETAARGRRAAAHASKSGSAVPHRSGEAKRKNLNLNTYKYHALGDYPDAIRERGTTDNYTTQPVSCYLPSTSSVEQLELNKVLMHSRESWSTDV